MVGLVLVPQAKPLAVTLDPPSLLITPPLLAVVPVIEEAAVVLLKVGTTAGQVPQVGTPLQNTNV